MLAGKSSGKWIKRLLSVIQKLEKGTSEEEIGLHLSGEELGRRRELMFVEHLLGANCITHVTSF